MLSVSLALASILTAGLLGYICGVRRTWTTRYESGYDDATAHAWPKPSNPTELRAELMRKIAIELNSAYAKHGRLQWGRHEFYAILVEEVCELWDCVKGDAPSEQLQRELIQVAAMCFRYYETGNRYGQGSPKGGNL